MTQSRVAFDMQASHLLPINLEKQTNKPGNIPLNLFAAFQTFSSPLFRLLQLIWCDVDVKLTAKVKYPFL